MLRLALLLIAALPALAGRQRRRSLKQLTFAFYNLAPAGERGPNDRALTRRELRALANLNPRTGLRLRGLRRRRLIAVCEAVGRPHLPRLLGYRLIKDRSTTSRANVALYVVWWLPVTSIEWVDLERDWWRPKDPDRKHEARSILIVRILGIWTVIVGHAPQGLSRRFPAHVNRTLAAARIEFVGATVRLIAHGTGPVLVLTDPNGVGPRVVRRLGALGEHSVVAGGTATEAVHGNGITIDQALTPGRVNGEPMRSDHRKALVGAARAR